MSNRRRDALRRGGSGVARGSAVIVRALLILCVVTGAFGAGLPAPPWEKNHLRIGQALYREKCIVCHDIDQPQSKRFGLFRREKMPLGNTKPSREYIKVRVKFGGALMPAFRQCLSDRDIDTLIDYIAAQ